MTFNNKKTVSNPGGKYKICINITSKISCFSFLYIQNMRKNEFFNAIMLMI